MDDLIDVNEQIEHVEDALDVFNVGVHPKVYGEHVDPFELYSDTQFRKRYRLKKETARFVITLVEDRLQPIHGNRGRPVPASVQVLATIRYLGKGAYEEDVGDIHSFHQSTLSRIVRRVVTAIATHRDRFIYMPQTAEDVRKTKQDFFNIANCPSIIGAIDGTHVKIRSPGGEYPLLYMNRKGFYSINVQVVSDAHCRIRDIVARWRGSIHDARIWDESILKQKFDNGQINGILLGDSGYPASQYILTPVLNPATDAETRYNRSHVRTRNVVERLFGLWKGKFRSMFNGLQLNIDTTKAAIIATAILHNIYINDKDIDEDEFEYEDEEEEGEVEDNAANRNIRGNLFRQEYINRHFL